MAPLAARALSGLESTGVSKILGNGIIIPLTKQQEIIDRLRPYLTNTQINQMLKTNKLKLTKRQSQNGGFSPLLLGALGSLAAPVLGSLLGTSSRCSTKGATRKGASSGCATKVQMWYYELGKRTKDKKKKKKNDGVFDKHSRQWASNCGIIKEKWRFGRYMPNFLKTRIRLLKPRCHFWSVSAIARCYMKYQILRYF